MKRVLVFAIVAAVVAISPASAEMKKARYSASNGVVIDVNSDDFAGRAEYSAPSIKFNVDGGGLGFALVAKVRRDGHLGPLNIQGGISYSGDWRNYGTAIFKGGEEAKFTSMGHDVGSCRYGCTLSEGFMIEPTADQIRKYAENGVLPIQIRGKSSDTAMIEIPVSYIDAVTEVAK